MNYKLLLVGLALGALAGGLTAYQDARDQIMFPHQFHVEDMEIECLDCHTEVAASNGLSIELLPVMDTCLECHDGDTASEECELCHTNPEDADVFDWQPALNLQFSHSDHLLQKLECTQCHTATAGREALEARTPLTADDCMDCHARRVDEQPVSHNRAWIGDHGFTRAGTDNSTCGLCHQESYCEDCHAMAQIEKRVHPPNWEFLHAGDFLGYTMECGTCHAMPEDCMSCHLGRGIMPISHNLPGWAASGSLHGQEALSRPDYCLACHEPAVDATCQRIGCHAN